MLTAGSSSQLVEFAPRRRPRKARRRPFGRRCTRRGRDKWLGLQSLELGPPAIGDLSHRFFYGWEGSPATIDYRKKIGYLPLF